MILPPGIGYTGRGSTQFVSNPIMSSDTRDSLALYVIAAAAVLATLFADIDLGDLFAMVLARL